MSEPKPFEASVDNNTSLEVVYDNAKETVPTVDLVTPEPPVDVQGTKHEQPIKFEPPPFTGFQTSSTTKKVDQAPVKQVQQLDRSEKHISTHVELDGSNKTSATVGYVEATLPPQFEAMSEAISKSIASAVSKAIEQDEEVIEDRQTAKAVRQRRDSSGSTASVASSKQGSHMSSDNNYHGKNVMNRYRRIRQQ